MSNGEAYSKTGMDNYEGALETAEPTLEDSPAETIKHYAVAALSPAHLGMAAGAMALSLALHLIGRSTWARFVAKSVAVGLIFGAYLKQLRGAEHDHRADLGHRGYRS